MTTPTDALAQAAASSHAASERLLLLGGESGVLLLAFTVLTAAALRRDVGAARRRLQWHGARGFQVELHTLFESLALGLVGALIGFAVGGVAAAVVASRAGSPAGAVVSARTALGQRARNRRDRRRSGGPPPLRLRPRALGARRPADVHRARRRRRRRDRRRARRLGARLGRRARAHNLTRHERVPPARPGPGRLCGDGPRGAPARTDAARDRQGSRRGPIALRLAAASLARNPGNAAIASTFLVASLGLALFTVAYRSTLLHGETDEARYAVPADYVLAEDLTQLVPVLHGAGHLPATPTQVIRLSGSVPAGATFGFLALPASKLADVEGWRSDFSTRPRSQLARLLSTKPADPPDAAPPAGPQLHAGRDRQGRRRVGARVLPLGARRRDRRPARPHRRRPARRAARPDPVPARDARAARPRLPQQRPHHGERGHRHPAERPRRDPPRRAARRRNAGRERIPRLGRHRRCRRTGREPRLSVHARPHRRLPAAPTHRRRAAARARDARRRGCGWAARDRAARGRGRADRRPHRRHDRPLPVGGRRRGGRRPDAGFDAARDELARARHDERAVARLGERRRRHPR